MARSIEEIMKGIHDSIHCIQECQTRDNRVLGLIAALSVISVFELGLLIWKILG